MSQNTSEFWKMLFQAKNTVKEYKFEINNVEYGPENEVSHTYSNGLFEDFGFGNAYTASITLDLIADDIPRGSTIKRYVRLKNGEQVSEWIPKGTFFTNTRSNDDGYWRIEAYDAMRKGETVWVPDQELEFPLSMPTAVEIFASMLGVELDSRTVLNENYTIDYPANDYTVRNELCFIAAAHGGNWIITDENKLYLVPLVSEQLTIHSVGLDIVSFENSGKYRPVSRVTLLADDESAYTAGTDLGIELSASCPFANQEMVNALLSKFQGYQYQSFTADAVNLDPAAELGDGITVNGINSVISKIEDDGYGYPDISAPGEVVLEEEYPSAGPATQQFNQKLAKTRSEITKTAEEINLKIEATDGRVSEVEQTVDGITLTVTSSTSPDGQTTASIILKVGPNSYTGYIKLDGNVDVSGQLSAEALYAALGDIADLTVDRLSTSRRIVKYLAGDQSDDNYIRIQEQYLEFVAGVYAGGTEQATNPNGGLIYWEADPEGATIGSDGYPYVDGERIFTTTTETDWPVMVYTYNELVKRSIAFEQQGEQYVPVDVFGAGDSQGRQKGRLLKDTEGLLLGYQSQSGKDIGLHMGDDGYMDLYGLRKTTGLNFGEWDSGRFYERIDGDDTRYQYDVAFDAQGRPVKITDSDGHETIIDW